METFLSSLSNELFKLRRRKKYLVFLILGCAICVISALRVLLVNYLTDGSVDPAAVLGGLMSSNLTFILLIFLPLMAVMAASEANIQYFSKLINIQTIGFDKINQLRHVLFLKDKAHTRALMKQHAAILAPKFHAVLDALDKEIAPLGIAGYKRPVGGYFVSVDAMPGCAKRTLALCKEAGVTMTGAGATFPYGKDPQDSNIRIAPSYPTPEELAVAVELFVLCVKLVSIDKILEEK